MSQKDDEKDPLESLFNDEIDSEPRNDDKKDNSNSSTAKIRYVGMLSFTFSLQLHLSYKTFCRWYRYISSVSLYTFDSFLNVPIPHLTMTAITQLPHVLAKNVT